MALVLWGQTLWRDERLESSRQGRAACWGEISNLNRACKNRARAVVAGWDRMQCRAVRGSCDQGRVSGPGLWAWLWGVGRGEEQCPHQGQGRVSLTARGIQRVGLQCLLAAAWVAVLAVPCPEQVSGRRAAWWC